MKTRYVISLIIFVFIIVHIAMINGAKTKIYRKGHEFPPHLIKIKPNEKFVSQAKKGTIKWNSYSILFPDNTICSFRSEFLAIDKYEYYDISLDVDIRVTPLLDCYWKILFPKTKVGTTLTCNNVTMDNKSSCELFSQR